MNEINKFVTVVTYTITYYNDAVQAEIMALPATLQARYICLTERMIVYGVNLGKPHTEAFGGGLFELRLRRALLACSIARWLAARSLCCMYL